MKQLFEDLRSHQVKLEDVPAPACQPGGVLVRTAASLISSGTERATVELGSKSLVGMGLERPDLVKRFWRKAQTAGLADAIAAAKARLEAGIALGYSAAGTVLERGEGAEDFTAGDAVACAGAGYASHAEVNWIPRNLCLGIPPGVDFESAAAVAVGGIALEGVRGARVQVGERVAVIGLGLVGLLTTQILKAAGAEVWGIDLEPGRVALAESLGADFASTPDGWRDGRWGRAAARGEGPDAVIITAASKSAAPIELAGEIARHRGVVVVVGDVKVEVPREHYYRKELELRYSRSYGPGRYDPEYEERGHDYPYGYVRWTEKRNMQAFLDLVGAGKVRVGPLVTHRFSIEDGLRAYELLTGGAGAKYIGILLTYPGAAAASAPPAPESRVVSTQDLPEHDAGLAPATKSSGRQAAAGQKLMTGQKLTIGWIGAGTFSRAKLLPALKKVAGVELAGVANSTGLSAQRAAKGFGFRYASTDPNEVLGDAAVQAVVIATRHHLHAPQVIAALRQGKHVFVEKPLCVSESELEDISAAYASAGRILMVGFNRRFSPFARECRRFFGQRGEQGPLSILYRVNAGPLPASHWVNDPEQGHGRVIGELCHFVDFAQYVTGSEPRLVRAAAVRESSGAGTSAEDNLHIEIAFADGSRGEILYLSSGDASVAKERVEIFGGGRTAISEDFAKSSFYASGRRKDHSSRQDKGHQAELQAFVDAVRAGPESAASPIPFESLRLTTLTTFRIRESLATGRELPVSPP